MEGPYRVSDNTTVGEGLYVVPGTEHIILQHACEATIACTKQRHLEYMLVDLSLTCHIHDTDALIADLNTAIATVDAEQSD